MACPSDVSRLAESCSDRALRRSRRCPTLAPARPCRTNSTLPTRIPMQTIVSQLDHAFRAAIQAAFGVDADPLISVAQNEKFGDYQSNAAMGLAKELGLKTGQKANPRAVA